MGLACITHNISRITTRVTFEAPDKINYITSRHTSVLSVVPSSLISTKSIVQPCRSDESNTLGQPQTSKLLNGILCVYNKFISMFENESIPFIHMARLILSVPCRPAMWMAKWQVIYTFFLKYAKWYGLFSSRFSQHTVAQCQKSVKPH